MSPDFPVRSGFALFAVLALSGFVSQTNAQTKPDAKPSNAKTEPKKEEPPSNHNFINADRPGIADGSTTIGPKRFQIEIGYQNEFRKTGTDTERLHFVPTLLRFGISDRWEFRVEGNNLNYAYRTTPGAPPTDTAGFAPFTYGFKLHFLDRIKGGKRPSVGTIVRVSPASGSGDFKQSHFTGDIRLAADWNFAPDLVVNPNFGIGVYEDGNGVAYTTGLVAVTLSYLNRARTVNPFVDFGLQTQEESHGRAAMIWDTGIAFTLKPNVQLDVSVGTGAAGKTAPRPFIGAGLSVRF